MNQTLETDEQILSFLVKIKGELLETILNMGYGTPWIDHENNVCLEVYYYEPLTFDPWAKDLDLSLLKSETKKVICKCKYQALKPGNKSIIVTAFRSGRLVIEEVPTERNS